ncbi:MAG: hypothetical protein GW778_04680 [Alphaproteobacteria bacterium]|nr:hypothetical protein [Alphaproteobacteria bacterium]
MAISIKFDEQSVLPELARQLVDTLKKNPAAVVLGIEDDGSRADIVFGLDGTPSTEERFIYTDVDVLVGAKAHCASKEPEFTPQLQGYIERVSALVNSPAGPIRSPGSLARQAPEPSTSLD